MQARWGIAWLVTALSLLLLFCAPGLAVGGSASCFLPILPIAAQSSLESQMQGERPLPPAGPNFPGMQPVPSLQLHNEGGDAGLKLPLNTELNISIRYNRDPSPGDPQPLSKSPLYMKYAVDYRLLPNLRVGLNSYLYRPAEEGFPFQSSMASPVVGVGPELKYDLGRWNFLLKSQMETSNRDQGKEGKDLQNWFRVWYAF
jgi:hypothetical protein